jgi:hypothetical protein
MSMNLKTINESMRDSIVELDAIERKAELGYIFVDLSMRGKVTAAYFEAKGGYVHTLDPTSKLQVITSNEDGVSYYDITGQDIFDRKNDSGNPLFAGMNALYYKQT